jgi:hypothetical protein
MTHVQAQEAVAQGTSFALCVVPLPQGQPIDEELVKNRARFVPNIGDRLKEQVGMVQDIQNRTLQTVSLPGEIEVVVQEGAVRYRVKEQVWDDAAGFADFLVFLVGKLSEGRSN